MYSYHDNFEEMTLKDFLAHSDVEHVRHELRGDLDVLIIDNANVYCEILMQGAQLITYTPKEAESSNHPVIWRSRESAYDTGVPIRGGVPVIGPWFGNLSDNPTSIQQGHTHPDGAIAHGFLRTVQWELLSLAEEGGVFVCILRYVHDGHQLDWPHAFSATMRFEVGAALAISYEIENTGAQTLAMSAALHTYFSVGDIDQVRVHGFDGVAYLDALDGRTRKVWEGDVFVDREVDVVFLDAPQEQVIVDAAYGRRISLVTRGSTSAIVWNPWTDKAKKLSMFGDDEYKEMLCIETARVEDDLLKIESGENQSFGVTITANSLTA